MESKKVFFVAHLETVIFLVYAVILMGKPFVGSPCSLFNRVSEINNVTLQTASNNLPLFFTDQINEQRKTRQF